MNKSSEKCAQLLRHGDPAAGVDIHAIRPSFDLIAERASHVPAVRRGWSPERAHRRRALLVGSCVAASAFVAIAVGWPGPGTGTGTVADAVTTRPDGAVDFNLSAALNYDPSDLQTKLRAAGVRAVVLFESPAGKCNEAVPNGDSSSSQLVQFRDQDHSVIIHPQKLHADETMIFMLPPPAEPGEPKMQGGVTIIVTRQKPPTCAPQSVFPVPLDSPFIGPASSGSPAIPTSVPSPVPTDGYALQSVTSGGVVLLTLNSDARNHVSEIQNALVAAGVPAVVLIGASPKQCGTTADGGVVPDGTFGPYARLNTVAIRPRLIPSGATFVVVLSPSGNDLDPAQEMYVATKKAPGCVQSTEAPVR